VFVLVEDGNLTLEAKGASRGEILHTVAREAGFRVKQTDDLADDLDEPVDVSVTAVPVDRAVVRLLQGLSAVLVYAAPAGQGQQRLDEVNLLEAAATADDELSLEPASAPADLDAAALWSDLTATGDTNARLRTVRALTGRADPQSVEVLALALETDEDPVVRRAVVGGIGKIRVPKARAALTGALSDEDPHVRRRAVDALARTWGSDAVAPLGRALADSPDSSLRSLAAMNLGRIGGPEAQAALQEAQSDPEPSVRDAASAALTRLETLDP
jgi:HEAT repeat protein